MAAKIRLFLAIMGILVLITGCRSGAAQPARTGTAPQASPTLAPTNPAGPLPTPTALAQPVAESSGPTPTSAQPAEAPPVVTPTQAAPGPTPTQVAPTPETPPTAQQPEAPTPTPAGSLPPSASNPADCTDLAAFGADLSIPDNTVLHQGEEFTKGWRLYNAGTCTWDSSYQVVFAYGDLLSAAPPVPLPNTPPGSSADISITMKAPQTPGLYAGNWEIQSPSGQRFGVGLIKKDYFWVQVNVSYVGSGGETSQVISNPVGETGGQPSGGEVVSTASGSCAYTLNPDYEDTIVQQINDIRARYGLGALTVNPQLSAAARWYSADMACNNRVDPTRHTDSEGNRWPQRIQAQGYSPAGSYENVWYGNPAYGGTPEGAMNWWMGSQVHKDNILNPDISEIGVGYVYFKDSDYNGYYTVDFARP